MAQLLPNEQRMFAEAEVGREPASSDEAINERYVSGEVRIVTEQARYPLTSIRDMVEGDSYELNPDFQRRHRWDNQRKSRLIESFIINVPIPPIFLYEAQYSYYEVMDGLQRLTAIRDFYADDFELAGLSEWSELNGRTYSTLPEDIRRGVDRRYLSSIILLHETAKDEIEARRLKQLVFERINSGGEKLTHQESRNAIYPGPMNSLCLRLSRNAHLCELWNIPEPTVVELETGSPAPEDAVISNKLYRTMGDAELVLRFFAYRQQLEHQQGRALTDYLDEYLRLANLLPSDELAELGGVFESALEVVHQLFGDRAFLLPKLSNGRWIYPRRPTLTVYDPMMWAAAQTLSRASELIANKESAPGLLREMYQANAEGFSGRTANPADIRARNVLFAELMQAIADGRAPAATEAADELYLEDDGLSDEAALIELDVVQD